MTEGEKLEMSTIVAFEALAKGARIIRKNCEIEPQFMIALCSLARRGLASLAEFDVKDEGKCAYCWVAAEPPCPNAMCPRYIEGTPASEPEVEIIQMPKGWEPDDE